MPSSSSNTRRYLLEVQYRFNRRVDLAAMVQRMAVAIVTVPPYPNRNILKYSTYEHHQVTLSEDPL